MKYLIKADRKEFRILLILYSSDKRKKKNITKIINRKTSLRRVRYTLHQKRRREIRKTLLKL